MRLVQLARLLQVSPTVLEEFLKHRNSAAAGTNARLTDEDITAAVLHFAPDKLREIMASRDTADDVPAESGTISSDSPLTDSSPQSSAEKPASTESSTDVSGSGPTEVIRAPKVELPGLRVVGKIELPEPVKREKPESAQEETPDHDRPRRKFGDQRVAGTGRRRDTAPRNPIQAQRERERREAEQRRREEERLEKERKTLAYVRQQAKREQKPAQPKKKQKEKSQRAQEGDSARSAQRPKSIFGRFWRWLAHGE